MYIQKLSFSLQQNVVLLTFLFIRECLTLIIIIINVSRAANHHISEGSCDTKDWSNDAENSALHHRNKLHFQIYSNKKNCYFKL